MLPFEVEMMHLSPVPTARGLLHVRVRDLIPSPHVRLQSVNEDHGDQLPFAKRKNYRIVIIHDNQSLSTLLFLLRRIAKFRLFYLFFLVRKTNGLRENMF